MLARYIFLSDCNNKGQTSGLRSLVPLEICIVNAADYQFFRLLNRSQESNTIGFQSYATLEECLYALKHINASSVMSATFPRVCSVSDIATLSAEALTDIPQLDIDQSSYVEWYYSNVTCDDSALSGFTVVPVDTCLNDESLFIFFNKYDFILSSTDRLRKQYDSSNGSCYPTQGTFAETIPITHCSDAASSLSDRLSYGCGLYVKSSFVFTGHTSSTEVISQTELIAIIGILLVFIMIVCCVCELRPHVRDRLLLASTNEYESTNAPLSPVEEGLLDMAHQPAEILVHQEQDPLIPPQFLSKYRNREEASEHWYRHLAWRSENRVDFILDEQLPQFNFIKKFFPHYFHGTSIDGDIVLFVSGKPDIYRLLSEIGVQPVLRYFVFVNEWLSRRLTFDLPPQQLIAVYDASNIKVSDISSDSIALLQSILRIAESHYIDRCKLLIILSPPIYFPIIWRGLSPLLSERSKSMIRIVYKDLEATLQLYILRANLPAEYYGTANLGSDPLEIMFREFVTSQNIRHNASTIFDAASSFKSAPNPNHMY